MCSYSDAAKRLGVTHNEFAYQFASSEYGFTVADYANDKFIIYYNDWKDEKTIRFTLAHELGHIKLRHSNDNEVANKEANCFARNILCPVQIIKQFGLSTPEEYANCFGISMPMAQASLKNRSSDFYYVSKELYNKINDKIYEKLCRAVLYELCDYTFDGEENYGIIRQAI